jgi:hypothetical protein
VLTLKDFLISDYSRPIGEGRFPEKRGRKITFLRSQKGKPDEENTRKD